MKTNEFLRILQNNKELPLLFTYQSGKDVAPGYHITEVKNLRIDSVDCGGKEDQWNETIIQLWESPIESGDNEFMTAYKALGILNKVDRLRPMDKDAEVKFEYSNADFHTSQMSVASIDRDNGVLRVTLSTVPTDCKAKSECGVPEPVLANEQDCCGPNSTCC